MTVPYQFGPLTGVPPIKVRAQHLDANFAYLLGLGTLSRFVSPSAFGGDVLAADNTSAIQSCMNYAALNNVAVLFDGLYKATGLITVNCTKLSIVGYNPSSCGILTTGTSGGLVINCTAVTNQPTAGGSVFLSNFGLHAGAAGSGQALAINFTAQTPATASIPSLNMEYVHFGADDLTAHYWSSGCTVVNGQAMNINGCWAAGQFLGPLNTSFWLEFTTSGGAAGNQIAITNNIFFGSHKSIWIHWATSDIEGVAFTNNILISNLYAFYIDGSASAGFSPGFTFSGNQTQSNTAAIYCNKAAQIFVGSGNLLYTDGLASDGIVFDNCVTCAVEAANLIICITGLSSGSAIKAVNGSFPGQVMGGFLQGYTTGVSLGVGSTLWMVYPTTNNSITNPVVDLGTNNYTMELDTANADLIFHKPVNAKLGTIAAGVNAPCFVGTATWNDASVAFQGLLVQITNTASAAGARIFSFGTTGLGQFCDLDTTGKLSAIAFAAAAGGNFSWLGRSFFLSEADGTIRYTTNSGLTGITADFATDGVLKIRDRPNSAPGTLKATLQTATNATTGLTPGVLAASTNASIVVTDGSGQVYRIPCII